LTSLGLPSAAYSAALGQKQRAALELDWQQDKTPCIVATTAFGMGVDKAQVRFVAHWTQPTSIQRYLQESGRAGRDGLGGQCISWYSSADILRRWARAAGTRAQSDIFSFMQYRDDKDKCRHMAIATAFGHVSPVAPCEVCDICLSRKMPGHCAPSCDVSGLACGLLDIVSGTGRHGLTAFKLHSAALKHVDEIRSMPSLSFWDLLHKMVTLGLLYTATPSQPLPNDPAHPGAPLLVGRCSSELLAGQIRIHIPSYKVQALRIKRKPRPASTSEPLLDTSQPSTKKARRAKHPCPQPECGYALSAARLGRGGFYRRCSRCPFSRNLSPQGHTTLSRDQLQLGAFRQPARTFFARAPKRRARG
jgi:hypothetical protein